MKFTDTKTFKIDITDLKEMQKAKGIDHAQPIDAIIGSVLVSNPSGNKHYMGGRFSYCTGGDYVSRITWDKDWPETWEYNFINFIDDPIAPADFDRFRVLLEIMIEEMIYDEEVRKTMGKNPRERQYTDARNILYDWLCDYYNSWDGAND